MDRKLLQSKIAASPSAIRDWFSTDACVTAVGKLNDQFNMAGENRRIIPRLLLRLEIKDISPEYFAGALAVTLNVDKNRASMIVDEIKKSVLAPVEKDFTDYGVDLSLLDKFELPIVKPEMAIPKIIEEVRTAAKTTTPSVPLPLRPLANTAAPVPTPSSQQVPIKSPLPETIIKPSGNIPAPKPVVLQAESVSRPILNAPNFKIPTISEDIMGAKRTSVPLPTRPAVVEFGAMPVKKTAPPSSAPTPSMKTFSSMMPLSPEPMRTVTEITPETLQQSSTAAKSSAPTYAPLSQIPVPSPTAQKPQAPAASNIAKSVLPLPTPPKPPTPPAPPVSPTNKPV